MIPYCIRHKSPFNEHEGACIEWLAVPDDSICDVVDALVIEKVDGECGEPLSNLGYEAREVEPQPCGEPANFKIGQWLRCRLHIGNALLDALSVQSESQEASE